ncbi:DMT family transporter [Ruegeria profundi]|uniref:DMT family transporter n=1 Tax=Ruegeria profundi TaxID=1685378 RepID=UPI001CD1E182|nr:DMT family transporter [Ruegeria profundi]MCA0930031.1 DMT family transporter [Ruegeria profundi]
MPTQLSNPVSKSRTGLDLPVHGLMLVATFLVATSFPVASAITAGLDSVVLTLIRFTLATLLFAPLVVWRYGLVLPTLRDLLRYGVLSLLMVAFFWCMFAALRTTTPLNTAAIFALHPIITATMAAILLREKMSLSARVALPIGAVGAIWVIFRGDPHAFLALEVGQGDLVFLAGTFALAAYSTLVKVLHRGEPMARMTFWILATGAVWLLLLSLPRLAEVQWSSIPTQVFTGIAYLSVFTTIVTFFILQWSTTRIGPTRVASYTFLNPALVLFIGLALGENLPPMATWPGVMLAIVATLVLQANLKARSDDAKPVRHPNQQT